MPINRFPVKLILRTNRLIGFIECADRGIIVDTKFMPHLDWIWERQNRVPVLLASSVVVLCNRRGGLVDEALFLSGLPLFVSHYARRGLSTPLGDYSLGFVMRIAKRALEQLKCIRRQHSFGI